MYIILGILILFCLLGFSIGINEGEGFGPIVCFLTGIVLFILVLNHTLSTNIDKNWYDRQVASKPYYVTNKKELTTKYGNTRLWGVLTQSNWEFERGYTRKEVEERVSLLTRQGDCKNDSCKIFLETDR